MASFTFGDGRLIEASKQLTLPCYINNKRCTLETDAVDCNIPFLLRKRALQKGKMCTIFETDSLTKWGKATKLNCATSGHYLLPIPL